MHPDSASNGLGFEGYRGEILKVRTFVKFKRSGAGAARAGAGAAGDAASSGVIERSAERLQVANPDS